MERHCAWIMRDPDYIDYHDQQWGRPEYDDRKLFAMLCLEGVKAGVILADYSETDPGISCGLC